MIKRLDTVDVATTDADQVAALYQRNFGFKIERTESGGEALIIIGDARIRLRSRAEAALKSTGEGLAAIWLEADDVEPIAAALAKAGLKHHPVRREGDHRVLEVDPSAANMVPLCIFDSRG